MSFGETLDTKYLINGPTLSTIGDAIRAKEGTTEKYSPAAMAQKITDDLVKPSGTFQIKNAQQVDVSSYQYAKVTDANLTAGNIKKDVTILGVTGTHEGASAPILQSKSVTYTENGTATITSDEGYDGLSSVDVTVNVSGGGGGEDTVTVTLPVGPDKTNFDNEVTATYTNALGEIVANVPAGKAASYTVKKGSIFFIYGYLRDLASLSSPSLYGMAGDASTDPRFTSNGKRGVFFVCDSDVTVVY